MLVFFLTVKRSKSQLPHRFPPQTIESVRKANIIVFDFLQSSYNISAGVGKPTIWILITSDTNQAVQLLEMARGLKFCI